MKVMPASDARQSFAALIDAAAREPKNLPSSGIDRRLGSRMPDPAQRNHQLRIIEWPVMIEAVVWTTGRQ